MATIASASEDVIKVVTAEKGIKGDRGEDGTDGVGLNEVRKALIDSPVVNILNPNNAAVAGSGRMIWARATEGRGVNRYNQLASAPIDEPRESINGFMIEPAGTNLFLNSDSLSTQDVTVTAEPHTLSFYGTGTVTLTGAFSGSLVGTAATDRVDLTFTPTAGTLTCTVSGTVDYAQIEALDFASSYITSEGTQGARSPDIVTLDGFNNTPLLDGDFSILMTVHVDGFTSGEDFILSLPNGVDTDNKTVCLFINNGVLTWRISDGVTDVDCTYSVTAGNTYDLIMLKDSSTVALWVDGVEQSTNTHTLTIPTDTDNTIKIGGNLAGESKNCYCSLYNIRFYDFKLNPSELSFLSE